MSENITENQPLTKDIYQKTIAQLIRQLQSFEDQLLIVTMTSDYGETFKPIELVSKGFEDNDSKVYCELHTDGQAK